MIKYEDLTKDQQKAFDLLVSGANVFVNGEAGTGKSFTLKAFSEWCDKNKKSLIKLAPTGIAAQEIGGATLHHQFKLKLIPLVEQPYSYPEVLKYVDIILIDEISMCRIDVFEYIMKTIRLVNESQYRIRKGPIQIILTGDFFQLPPVITKEDKKVLDAFYKTDIGKGFAFQSKMWSEMQMQTITLKEVIRQEEKSFCEALKLARYGNAECVPYFNENSCDHFIEDAILLAGRNKVVDEYNDKKLSEIPGRLYHSYIKKEGEITSKDYPCDDDFKFKIGTKVMFLVNDPDGQYKNGTMGTIVAYGKESDFAKKEREIDEDIEENENDGETELSNEDVLQVKLDNGIKVLVKKYTFECKRYDAKAKKRNKANSTDNTNDIFNLDILLSEVVKDTDIVLNNRDEEERKNDQEVVVDVIGTAKQFPLRIAYAITIHKSQGRTFEKMNLNPDVFEEGQFYVAISRGKAIENIHINQKVLKGTIRASAEVLDFYSNPEEYNFFEKKFVNVRMRREQYDDLIKYVLADEVAFQKARNAVIQYAQLLALKEKAKKQ